MRSARTFLLVVAGLLVTAALAAPTSSAALEGLEEAGTHCTPVTTSGTDVNGGCRAHTTSNGKIELRKHVFGIESHIGSCDHEWAARLDESLSGRAFEQVLSGAGCARQACSTDNAEGEKNPWVASGTEASAQEGREFLTTNFCVEPREGGTDESCEIDLPFQTYEAEHRAEIGHAAETASHGFSGFRCELVGHWNTETGGTHDGESEQEVIVRHV